MRTFLGNAGAVVAGNLARSRARPKVLLIELGGDNAQRHLRVPSDRFVNPYKNPSIALPYRTTPQDHLDGRTLDYLRGKGLGGSSIANFLAYIRGTASDYNLWADMVNDNAFSWENVVARYKELENLHFDDDQDKDRYVNLKEGVHGFSGPVDLSIPSRRQWVDGMDKVLKAALNHGWPLNPDQNSGHLVGIGAVTTTSYDGYRVTSASAYLQNPPSNLVIWTESVVTKILFNTETKGLRPKAVGVLLADGRTPKARKEIVLSLGVIDSPKLLMLSGIGPQDELQRVGIPCVVDSPRVGKNMIDHNYVVLTWGATSELGRRAALRQDKNKIASAREQWTLDRTGPDATLNTINLIGFLKFDPSRVSFDELYKLNARTREYIEQPDVPQFELFLLGHVPDNWDGQQGEECLGMSVMLMNPQSRGNVTLASKNPGEMPLIDVNFFSHPYDRQTLVNGVREAMMFARSKDLAPHVIGKVLGPESESDEDVLKFCRKELMSVLHGVGTVVMASKDDKTAPASTDFRVRGVDGLRVMDLSVCPVLTK